MSLIAAILVVGSVSQIACISRPASEPRTTGHSQQPPVVSAASPESAALANRFGPSMPHLLPASVSLAWQILPGVAFSSRERVGLVYALSIIPPSAAHEPADLQSVNEMAEAFTAGWLNARDDLPPRSRRSVWCEITVRAAALTGNWQRNPDHVPIGLLVPEAALRGEPCELVLFLHGFEGDPSQLFNRPPYALREVIDGLNEHRERPWLVAVPGDRSQLGGGFYVNSQASGYWEDFITLELIPALELAFPIDPDPECRIIAGHSMGGFGAFYLGLRHPQMFGRIGCLSGMVTIDAASTTVWRGATRSGGLRAPADQLLHLRGREHFWTRLLWAMSAAFTPEPASPPLFGQRFYSADTGTGEFSADIPLTWCAFDLMEMIPDYAESLARCQGLYISGGARDSYFTIAMLDDVERALRAAATPARWTVVRHDGGHMDRLRNDVAAMLGWLEQTAPPPARPAAGSKVVWGEPC